MPTDTLFAKIRFSKPYSRRNDGTPYRSENPVVDYGNGTLGIVLDKGQIAVIDADDYPLVVGFHWYARKGNKYDKTYYACAPALTKLLYMHFVILDHLVDLRPDQLADHHNRNGLNNRRYNLRPCTRSYNIHNAAVRSHNKLGVKGVHRRAKDGRYKALIRKDKKLHDLGSYATIEEASAAYQRAAAELFEGFGNLSMEARCST
jgi:hypothetical protein